ncbi:putative protein kinase [Trypanosoma cruzi]|uniref:Protein kinase domain-containing protein n=2 Tax=Trypanosoma cruzi TaxID=5693 RepID=A0A2V2XDQ3_TRYCR|nr:putative protein kinase [Trypanosoma cruzi]RNC48941.1 putative protein kinase [Trypanosoma cruzi]
MDTRNQSRLGVIRKEEDVAAAVEAAAPQTIQNGQQGNNEVKSRMTRNLLACSNSASEGEICEKMSAGKNGPVEPGLSDGARFSVPLKKKGDFCNEPALVAQEAGSPEFFINVAHTRQLPREMQRGEVRRPLEQPVLQPAENVAANNGCSEAYRYQNGSQRLDKVSPESSKMCSKPTVNVVSECKGGSRILDTPVVQTLPAFFNCLPGAMSKNTIQESNGKNGFHSAAVFQHDSEDAARRVVVTDGNRNATQSAYSTEVLQGDLPSSIIFELQRLKHRRNSRTLPESLDPAINAKTPSPMPVTLVGAGNHHRRKHIKLVSSYILGPLLGEGVFGVVRDAIDTSANGVFPPRFQRVAIKSYKYRRPAAPGPDPIYDPVASFPPAVSFSKNVTCTPISDLKNHHSSKIQRMLENEVCNLQRFHCPNIIRGIDIFRRYGRDYVVLPIAICNLDQLVKETVQYELRQRQLQSNAGASFLSGQGSILPDNKSGSEMIIDLSCASYISAGETEMNLLSSTLGDSVFPLFSADFVRGVMYQLLHGVAYLHNQGLAHNDLKLQNILLFANGELKISDLGSVLEEYNDQGTPMYISPEVCKYFYCAEDVEDEKNMVKVDAFKNDMWSCGVILYYLLVGRPLWECKMDVCNRYQLFREIASQTSPIDLDYVPEPRETTETTTMMMDDSLGKGNNTSDSSATEEISPLSLRHLLRCLLDINPATRLSAKDAIEHPSLRALQLGGSFGNDAIGMAQREVAFRVSQSPHLQLFIKRDREKHLQFVAECCSTLNIVLPKEIFLPGTGESGCENEWIEDTDSPFFRSAASSLTNATVDRSIFPTTRDYHYYENKLGRAEHDLRSLLQNHAKVNMLRNYMFGTVLVECGYRNAEEAEAKRILDLKKNQMKLVAAEQKELLQAKSARALVATSNQKYIERSQCSGCFCGLM